MISRFGMEHCNKTTAEILFAQTRQVLDAEGRPGLEVLVLVRALAKAHAHPGDLEGQGVPISTHLEVLLRRRFPI